MKPCARIGTLIKVGQSNLPFPVDKGTAKHLTQRSKDQWGPQHDVKRESEAASTAKCFPEQDRQGKGYTA
jgi:hypothetical protein